MMQLLRSIGTCGRLGSLAALVALAASACVCPPCQQPIAQAEVAAGEEAKVTGGSRFIIWDGDGGGIEGGKGWNDCDKKPECKTKLQAMPGAGKDGTTGLMYHAEGPAWNGFGWNWFGWYPETAGTDISEYDELTFWMRIDAESPDLAPEPGALTVLMGCSKGQKNSADVPLAKFADNLLDGKWHQVVIPLKEFYKGKTGKEFDPKTAWEFRLSTWAPSPRNFTVYFDEIAVHKK